MSSKTLYVSLDKNKDPKVRVDPDVNGKAKMKWRKDDDSPDDFDFKDIDFEHNPDHFSVTRQTDSKIDADFDLTPGPHPYTITVEDSAGTYDSDPNPRIVGDKPVIRN